MKTLLLTTLAAICLLLSNGCDRGPDRTTPEGTLAAARWAVNKGQADRISDYIYADSQDMRRLLRRAGAFMGNVQRLGETIQLKFPDQVAKLKAETELAAKEGKATSLVSQITSQMRPNRGKKNLPAAAPDDSARDAFDDALKSLFADPYAWIRESETRLTTVFLTDDSVALLWDEKPILPPIGMVMKKATEDGRWYFALPTNLPGISNVMPKTKEQFEIFGGLIKVFDQVVVDLRQDIDSGKLTTLDEVSRAAGEKTFLPAALTLFAYSRLTETQKKDAAAKATQAK